MQSGTSVCSARPEAAETGITQGRPQGRTGWRVATAHQLAGHAPEPPPRSRVGSSRRWDHSQPPGHDPRPPPSRSAAVPWPSPAPLRPGQSSLCSGPPRQRLLVSLRCMLRTPRTPRTPSHASLRPPEPVRLAVPSEPKQSVVQHHEAAPNPPGTVACSHIPVQYTCARPFVHNTAHHLPPPRRPTCVLRGMSNRQYRVNNP